MNIVVISLLLLLPWLPAMLGFPTIAPTMFSSPFCFSIKLLVLSSIKQQLSLPISLCPTMSTSLASFFFFFLFLLLKKFTFLYIWYYCLLYLILLILLLALFNFLVKDIFLLCIKNIKRIVYLYKQDMCALQAIWVQYPKKKKNIRTIGLSSLGLYSNSSLKLMLGE